MPLISTRKQEYEPERPEFSGEKLRKGSYVCVMRPWPQQYISHNHPFKKDTPTQSWPITFEAVTNPPEKIGATITLWIECHASGLIKDSELGEGRFAPLREALRLTEQDEFDTAVMDWAIVKVIVEEKLKGKDSNGTVLFTSWVETLIRCEKYEQQLAADYLARMHPEVM